MNDPDSEFVMCVPGHIRVRPNVIFIILSHDVDHGMHMDSEKIDYLSGCGSSSDSGRGIFGRVRAALQKRKVRKARDINDMGPAGLVEIHNRVFGIDSTDPTAAMPYVRRKENGEVIVVTEPVREPEPVFRPSQPEMPAGIAEISVTEIKTQHVQEAPAGVATDSAGAAQPLPPIIDYNSDAPLPARDEAPARDVFTEVEEKYVEFPEDDVNTEDEDSSEDVCAELMVPDAAEFDDVRTEEIAKYVEAEIKAETRQTSLDEPMFDEECDHVSAEPVIVRQDRLDVEFEEPPGYTRRTEDASETNMIAAPDAVPAVGAPAETVRLAAPAEVPALRRPFDYPILPAPECSAEERYQASEFARSRNAANVAAGGYTEAQAAVFDSQIAEAEKLAADERDVAMSQILGGMLIASRITINSQAPAETAEGIVEETEAAVQADTELFDRARARNSSNLAAGLYDEGTAQVFESQISEAEASEDAPVQISQILGGMLIASRITVSMQAAEAPAEAAAVEAAEESEAETVYADPALFESVRAKNAANVAAGSYDERAAEAFESQIAEAEACGADVARMQVAQIMGGMLIASRITVSRTVEPEMPAEVAVEETVEEPVAETIYADPELFASARQRNASNVEAGLYSEATAGIIESQIADAESCPADIAAVQVSQIIGGMLIASRITVSMQVTEEPAEVSVEEPVIETVYANPELFESARARNASNVEAGLYGDASARMFESQIAAAESCPEDSARVQIAQIMGGMLIAARTAANAAAPVQATEEVPVAETVEEPVAEPVQEIDVAGRIEHVRGVNAVNVMAGRYGRAQGVFFESQISEAETCPADVAMVQLSQIIGGMLLACRPRPEPYVPEEVPEAAPEVEVTVPETDTEEIQEAVPETVAETAAEVVISDVPASQIKDSSSVSFRFRSASAPTAPGIRFIFGFVSE